MQIPGASIGYAFEEVETPSLIIELDAFERNIEKMARFAHASGIGLRPHAKTHKCPAIALRQLAAGAVGVCVQTVGEAEAMYRGGIRDILVSNQVVGHEKLKRLGALAKEARVTLCFDAPEQIDAASRAAFEGGVKLGGLIEIEVGMGRCGVLPGPPARELALKIAEVPNLVFEGLQAYNGKAQHLPTYRERESAIRETVNAVRETMCSISAVGLDCRRVCGAGTGTFRMEAASGLYNELQVGSYIFMDGEYAALQNYDGKEFGEFEHSLFIATTVVSVPTSDRAIVDAGLKSYTLEKGLPLVFGRPDLEVRGASDEHGTIRIGVESPTVSIGDRLLLIPGHCDPAVNLFDWYIGVRHSRVEEVWEITARGASR